MFKLSFIKIEDSVGFGGKNFIIYIGSKDTTVELDWSGIGCHNYINLDTEDNSILV